MTFRALWLSRFAGPKPLASFSVHGHRSTRQACRRTMFVQTEVTPNENALKFRPGVEVMGGGGVAEFTDRRGAMRSPLAKRIFNIDGVTSVFFGPDFVTINKDADSSWQLMKPEIYASLMEHFTSKQPLLLADENAENSDTAILPDDPEVVQMIKELLDTRIRPYVQEDGGDIEYKGYQDGIVSLKLRGSCRDCSSSAITLKGGIERMLKHYIPEIKSVEQFEDEIEKIGKEQLHAMEKKLNIPEE